MGGPPGGSDGYRAAKQPRPYDGLNYHLSTSERDPTRFADRKAAFSAAPRRPSRSNAARKMPGTLSEHPARVLHVMTFRVHAPFCRVLRFGNFAKLAELFDH